MARPQADLFHPLTSLEWQRELYSVLPFIMLPVQAAVLDGKVYVLGKKSAQSPDIKPRSRVYTVRHCGGSEIRSPSPTRRSAFTAYQDKLVLVGGIDATGRVTGKIHYLQKPVVSNSQWINDDVKLPPMNTQRCGAAVLSIGQHLLVAGGEGFDGAMTAVEVFNGKEWRPAASLPKAGTDMTSAVLNGEWILMGGTLGRSVFRTKIDDLIQCRGNRWKELPEAPLEKSCAAVFGNHLLAIGGKRPSLSPSDVEGEEDSAASTTSSTGSTAIHAYLPDDTPSWLHVEDLKAPTYSACAALLPSGELAMDSSRQQEELAVAVYNKDPQERWRDFTVYKLLLRVNSFPRAKLSLRALENLQFTAKMHLFRSIGAEWQQFVKLSKIRLATETLDSLQQPSMSSDDRGRVVVKSWLECRGFNATWKSLLQILLESSQQLEIVAAAIKQFFSSAALEKRVHNLEQRDEAFQSRVEALQKEKEALQRREEALRNREDVCTLQREEETIHKQTMKNEIEELVKPLLQDLKRREGSGSWVKWYQEREDLVAERDSLVAERDSLVAERDSLVAERESSVAERDSLVSERDAARAERDELKAQLAEMHQKAASTVTEGPKAPASKRRTEDDNGDAESHPKKRHDSRDVQTSPTSSSFNAPVEIATGATAMAVSHGDSLKPITVDSSSAIPSFSFQSGMHGQMQASLQPRQGQVMQQQPTEAQIKHTNLEHILTALERTRTPQQRQELFTKVRATPEQQQHLLNRVHARRQMRLQMQQQQQQQEQQQLQQVLKTPASKRMTEDDNGGAESHSKRPRHSLVEKHVDDRRGHVIGVDMDVIAETTFVIGSDAFTLDFKGCGVKLHILQNSLPADCQQCELKIRSLLSGKFKLPPNCELVSGVHWIQCPVKLTKAVTVEVQHYCTQTDKLSFVRATCTKESLEPYVFQMLMGGKFPEGSTYGSIVLSAFSLIGIVEKLVEWFSPPRYKAKMYRSLTGKKNTWTLYFTIIKELDLEENAFRQKLEREMMRDIDDVVVQAFPVKFEGSKIMLENLNCSDEWLITCQLDPVVLKETVDKFKGQAGNTLPFLQINVKFRGEETESTVTLSRTINLKGVPMQHPYQSFRLECIEPTTSQSDAIHQLQPVIPSNEVSPAVHQQQSHELAVFLKMRTSIRTGILPNIRDIAHRAFAQALIPKNTQRAITDGQMSTEERTDRFLEGLEPKIKLDGTCLMKFVEVLRQSDPYHDTLIKDITKALSSPSS